MKSSNVHAPRGRKFGRIAIAIVAILAAAIVAGFIIHSRYEERLDWEQVRSHPRQLGVGRWADSNLTEVQIDHVFTGHSLNTAS